MWATNSPGIYNVTMPIINNRIMCIVLSALIYLQIWWHLPHVSKKAKSLKIITCNINNHISQLFTCYTKTFIDDIKHAIYILLKDKLITLLYTFKPVPLFPVCILSSWLINEQIYEHRYGMQCRRTEYTGSSDGLAWKFQKLLCSRIVLATEKHLYQIFFNTDSDTKVSNFNTEKYRIPTIKDWKYRKPSWYLQLFVSVEWDSSTGRAFWGYCLLSEDQG